MSTSHSLRPNDLNACVNAETLFKSSVRQVMSKSYHLTQSAHLYACIHTETLFKSSVRSSMLTTSGPSLSDDTGDERAWSCDWSSEICFRIFSPLSGSLATSAYNPNLPNKSAWHRLKTLINYKELQVDIFTLFPRVCERRWIFNCITSGLSSEVLAWNFGAYVREMNLSSLGLKAYSAL